MNWKWCISCHQLVPIPSKALQVRGNCLWFWSLQRKVKYQNFAKCLGQWGTRRDEWLINYCLLSIQMASESPLVLSVFLSVHQYPPRDMPSPSLVDTMVKHDGQMSNDSKQSGQRRKQRPHIFSTTNTLNLQPRRSFTRKHFIPHWKHVSCREPSHLRDLWVNWLYSLYADICVLWRKGAI